MTDMISSYYYNFEATGNKEVDTLLYAIAQAGKCFHSTSQWTEETEWKSMTNTLKGKTPVDWIQNAANDLANSINKE